MKTPISYYGGKQNMLRNILPLIPSHNLYCEPFCGGAAVFFSKPVANVEVINDTNSELINFYRVAQNKFVELDQMVRVTLHSRRLHADAGVVYNNPHLFDEVKRAWAVWVLSSQSFAAQLDSTFGYDKTKDTTTKKISNKRESFSEELAIRLQHVTIECADALYVIKSRDTENSFFYVDPPYYNSDCGHYDGYSLQDFEMLLKALSEIKGKFLLSSYPSDILSKYTKENGWNFKVFDQSVSINNKSGYLKKKWEVLTANFGI
jgi:DNA adenine methylase